MEDAVALSEKEIVRENVKEALINFNNQKKMIIRINDIATPFWEDDLICAITNGANGVMVPKAEHPEDMKLICDKVREISGVNQNEFEVIPLIETAKGVQFSYSIASADEMISKMAFGSIDFSLNIDCELTPKGLELLYARSQIVTASKAAGLSNPIDAVYPDLNNEAGLEYEAVFAKQIGFKSKLIIHPKQIQIVHKVFSLSEKEINRAKDIVEVFEEAEQNGVAAISINNTFVDYPVYKRAKSIISQFSS